MFGEEQKVVQPLSPTHVVQVIIRKLEDNRQICRGRTRSGAAFVGDLGHLIGQGRIPTTFLWCKALQLTMHRSPIKELLAKKTFLQLKKKTKWLLHVRAMNLIKKSCFI